MKIIDDLKELGAVMLLDVVYHRPSKDRDWKDYLDIVFRDQDNVKRVLTIENPEVPIYFAKDEIKESGHNRIFIPLEDSICKEVRFNDIPFEIANEAGPSYQNYVKDCVRNGNRKGLRNMQKYPNVFGSDYPIEDLVRIRWLIEGLNEENKDKQRVTKGFLDIETDGLGVPGFIHDGRVPINAVTIIDDKGFGKAVSYTFLLRNERNPLISEFENDLGGFISELHEDFDESYGKIDYQFFMYDEADEIDMIRDMFILMHSLDVDMWGIWNMSFDIPYIIQRIEKLGYDPRSIMCDPRFEVQEAYFYKDKINFKPGAKTDYACLSAMFRIYDQMILYAAVRSSQSELQSFKLTDIGKHELNDGKLDYSEVEDFKTFPYENYRKFVKYNIKDVLLQLGIERKVNDVDGLFQRSTENATKFNKAFKQTVFLSNRAYADYWREGVIIGNNLNFDISNKDSITGSNQENSGNSSYKGGLVADPELIGYVGEKIMGKRSKYILKYVVDMDFKAMYPNIIITFNIAPNTMIGKIIIKLNSDEDNELYVRMLNANSIEEITEMQDLGTEFLNDIQSGDILHICAKWFNLPTVESMIAAAKHNFNEKERIVSFTVEKPSLYFEEKKSFNFI